MLASASKERPAERHLERVGPLWWGRVARVVVLGLTDIAALSLAVVCAALFWGVRVRHQSLGLYAELWPLLALFVLSYAMAELYPGHGLGAVQTLRRLTLRTSLIFMILAAASFALKTPQVYSRMTFFVAWALALVLLPVLRFTVSSLMTGRQWWGEPALLVGSGPRAHLTVLALQDARSLGYRPRWILPSGGADGRSFAGLQSLASAEEALELGNRGVRVVLVAEENVDNDLVEELRHRFRHVLLIQSGREFPIEGVRVRNLGAMLGIEFHNQLLLSRGRLLKRCMDLVVGGAAAVLAAPLIAVLALLVKVVSPGPAFFRQERIGLGGQPIRVVKLRTMHVDAQQRLEDYLEEDPARREEWERRFKLAQDPRVIPFVGKLLRRFSLDELPQLLSVLGGRMSLVGPRPFPDYHLEGFSPQFLELRARVKPGLTGLWQVMVRGSGGIEEQELYDTYYIRNWSIWMDLHVLSRTTLAVLMGKGAY